MKITIIDFKLKFEVLNLNSEILIKFRNLNRNFEFLIKIPNLT